MLRTVGQSSRTKGHDMVGVIMAGSAVHCPKVSSRRVGVGLEPSHEESLSEAKTCTLFGIPDSKHKRCEKINTIKFSRVTIKHCRGMPAPDLPTMEVSDPTTSWSELECRKGQRIR